MSNTNIAPKFVVGGASLVDIPNTATKLTTGVTVDVSKYITSSLMKDKVAIANPQSTPEKGETLEFANYSITNVYNGSKNLDPIVRYPVKTGTRLYAQIRENVSVDTQTSSGLKVALPYSASISITVPDALLTGQEKAQVATEVLRRLLSQLFPKGMEDTGALTNRIFGDLISE